MKERRLCLILVPRDLLPAILSQLVEPVELPDGVTVAESWYNPAQQAFSVMLEHPSFSLVAPSGPVPYMDVTFAEKTSQRILAANEAEPFRMIGAAENVAAISPIAESVGHADNWFQVSPFGRFPHRVGMQVFDQRAANSIVTLFKSVKDKAARLWRGLPIYVGHPDLDPKAYTDPKKYGSIQDLEVREDGLYAKAKWSKPGKEIVNDELYDFQSPLWNMEPVPNEAGAFRPVELISVGLTNRPNIPGKPVGANTNPADADLDPMKRDELIQKFKLTPATGTSEVTDAQITAAVDAALSAANERTTLTTQLQAANEGRTTAERERGEQTTRADNERKARIEDQLTVAANSGRITEAEKAGWRTRLETAYDAAVVELGKLKPAMNTRTTHTGDLGHRNGGEAAMTRQTRIQAANEAVDTYMQTSGTKDYAAAWAYIERTKPELFKDMQQPETATAATAK